MLSILMAIATITQAAPDMQNAGDGASVAQATSMMRDRIMQNDKDGDGRLSKSEFEAVAAARGGRGAKFAGRMFSRLDTNSDGYLDSAEVDKMVSARIARLDSNGDGRISREEGQAARAARGGGSDQN